MSSVEGVDIAVEHEIVCARTELLRRKDTGDTRSWRVVPEQCRAGRAPRAAERDHLEQIAGAVRKRLTGQHQPQRAHHHLVALAVPAEVELPGVHQDQPHQFGDTVRNRFVVAEERVGVQESSDRVSDRWLRTRPICSTRQPTSKGSPWNGVAQVLEAQ